jgi:hypothetical protein
MAEFLSMDNILTGDEAASLFTDEDTQETQTTPPSEKKEEKETKETKEEDTTEVNPDNLFDEEPESVGSEENKETNKEQEKDTTSEEDGTSPKTNFYSSIASALKEEGIFPDLDDAEIDNVKEAEDFRDLIEKQINAGLEEAQKRIYDALNTGVEPNVIRQYESTLGYLNSITEEQINDESEKGEQLRKQLLQQDFINRGYSQERAIKMTEKLFASGEDIEEAKQALQGNKDFFNDKYKEILDDAKKKEEEDKKAAKKQAEQLKKDILSGDKIFGEVEIDKATRQKVYDNISKPVYKDPETGEYYTALQKYKLEHENDFIKNVGLLFTLTDGFTNLDKLVSPSAKKEVKKKLKELEHTLNNTARNDNGTLKLVGSGNAPTGKSVFD